MKRIAWGCAGVVFASLTLWQGRASACSVILPEKQSLSCPAPGDAGRPHTSVAGARLELGILEVRRSQYAPPGRGDCGELGHLRMRFNLAGEREWPQDVGLLLTLKEGEFPYFQPPLTQLASASGWLLLPPGGEARFLGPDDPQRPLQIVLEARAVDCNDAVSAPLEVRISDPGRPADAGESKPTDVASAAPGAAGAGSAALASSKSGCAFTAPLAPARPGGIALGALALALTLGARRRWARASGPASRR